jgi:protocatechuate 3,4-dioxygenase beta subunit
MEEPTGPNSLLRWAFLKNKNAIAERADAPKLGDDYCVMTTSQVEGPFYLSAPVRQDITEDRQGVLLNVSIEVVDAQNCLPIEGATVEIWHCDAEGKYSGYPEDTAHDFVRSLQFTGIFGMIGEKHVEAVNEKRYLRGAQHSDANGRVTFKTIFPGWYEPRATHIHMKVLIGHEELLTSQVYFNGDLADEIYSSVEPYKQYGKCPYSINNDLALRNLKEINGVLLAPTWVDKTTLDASVKIGVKRLNK